MSTAHATITFYRIDPARERPIIAALRDFGFRFEYVDSVVAPVRLFRTYGVRDAHTLICDQLGTLMRKLDRSAVFAIGQDPNHEFGGQVLVSDPDLGDFCCAADEEATPLVCATAMQRATEAARLAVAAGVDADTAFTQLDRLAGGPWWRRLHELRTTPDTAGTQATPLEVAGAAA